MGEARQSNPEVLSLPPPSQPERKNFVKKTPKLFVLRLKGGVVRSWCRVQVVVLVLKNVISYLEEESLWK